VTSASLRRVDFYNSRDDENDEAEEKIFQHNFGASIRGGRGMFAVVNQEQEMEEKSSRCVKVTVRARKSGLSGSRRLSGNKICQITIQVYENVDIKFSV
jgi:hypothetical protein